MSTILLIFCLGCLLAGTLLLVRTLPAQNIAFIILFLAAVEVSIEYWNGTADLQYGAMFWPGMFILLRKAGQVVLRSRRQDKYYWLYFLCLPSGVAAVVQYPITSDDGLMVCTRFCLTAGCLIFLTPWFLQKRITASGEPKE